MTLAEREANRFQYKPLFLLLDLVKFILLSSPPGTGPYLMDEVVGLAQKTADINVIPRFRRFAPATTSSPKTALKTNDEVDINECLRILYLIALACARRQADITRFWRLMRFDFIMMICRNSQPVEDVHLMLKLLSSSVQENTFAMITDPAKQVELEQHVIDRVTAMLIENPKAADGDEPYDTVEIAEMRLQILCLMEKLCDKRHGGEALAKHPLAVGRLVRVMNDELNALYDHKAGHEHRFVPWDATPSNLELLLIPCTEPLSSTKLPAYYSTSHPPIQNSSTCKKSFELTLVVYTSI